LRHIDRERLIRADGACINQNDLDERAEQVRLMGDIYPTARQTIVFLGNESDESSAGFERMMSWWEYY
ncbi:uncharacterized protein BDZ99DRAFT_338752, partial [Mytilinidion resinicola]